MPTGWRPADVAERYPVAIIDNPEDQKKYDPKSSTGLKVWAAIQMVLSVVSAMFLFNHLVAINEAGLHLRDNHIATHLVVRTLCFSQHLLLYKPYGSQDIKHCLGNTSIDFLASLFLPLGMAGSR